tara:strand:+ start:963 stop:1109 length:147 start_codon:yes stop_codon:yes gene_type:complete
MKYEIIKELIKTPLSPKKILFLKFRYKNIMFAIINANISEGKISLDKR